MLIKVVTFNLRCDSEEGFSHRLPIALKKINSEKPDIIGFQEARPHMQKSICAAMPEYTVLGYGRDADYGGESNCIAFRKDLYELYGFEQRWLSPTPYIPGSRFKEQSPCPRILVTVMLKHHELKEPFRFYNTHLDHVGEEARRLGMAQILEQIKHDNDLRPMGIILTGDMNASPDSVAITEALDFKQYPLKDTTAALTHTFHDFGKITSGCKIDYIFTDIDNASGIPYIWDDNDNGITISDHYPVSVDINLQ